MISGWPERKSQVDPELGEYWKIKGEISVCDDLLLRQDRLIVPSSLREKNAKSNSQQPFRHRKVQT